MSSLNILIYDDHPLIASRWAKAIRDAYRHASVKPEGKESFQELLGLINRRRNTWRQEGNVENFRESHPVDKADVVVVDYDLLDYSDTGDTTGSRLAYLLRSFTRCGFIIILNEFGDNVFDLSLSTPTSDFADIHIGAQQLGNLGLWQPRFDGYRPWYWPVIPNAKQDFDKCVEDVQNNFDVRILDFLDLSRVIDWLPPEARAFLTGEQPLEKVTFKDFIVSGLGGISIKDKIIPEQMARVAAARIITLLNLIILPEQSVLVDAPHLVSRFPSLLLNDDDGRESWNKLCNPVDNGVDELLSENLKQYRFSKSHWLWRPAWYWPDINRDENISEVRDPWTFKEPGWVFCEDISKFVPTEVAKDFRAIVSPPFITRFIFDRDSKDAETYVNQLREGGPQDLFLVQYVPGAALSL